MLHIFDMDGTVLTGTTASLVIAERTGTSAELHGLEKAAAMTYRGDDLLVAYKSGRALL